MNKTYSLIRKIVVLSVGVPLFIIGLILIPLPGPGLLVSFAALFILSMEFDWAKVHVERAKEQIKKVADKAKTR